jgi:Phasin protein
LAIAETPDVREAKLARSRRTRGSRPRSEFQSPHQRRVRNKPEPRFDRKHGEVLTFNLIRNIHVKFDLEQGNSTMSTTQQHKSSGKPRQRSPKVDQRGKKPERQSPKLDQRNEDQIDAMVASTDVPTNGAAEPAELPSSGASAPADVPSFGEIAPADARSIGAVAPADNSPVSIQTIANAYGNYTKKSFQDTRSLVEKLMGVRSFDKAIEVQTEFARQAYVSFVAESQKICELYSELAKQIFRSWEGFAAKVTQAGR